MRASFMVQWLRIHLPMQRTWIWPLFQDSTCPGASKPVCRNYWVPFPRARAPQQEKPREAWALQLESSPLSLQLEKACVQQQRPRMYLLISLPLLSGFWFGWWVFIAIHFYKWYVFQIPVCIESVMILTLNRTIVWFSSSFWKFLSKVLLYVLVVISVLYLYWFKSIVSLPCLFP